MHITIINSEIGADEWVSNILESKLGHYGITVTTISGLSDSFRETCVPATMASLSDTWLMLYESPDSSESVIFPVVLQFDTFLERVLIPSLSQSSEDRQPEENLWSILDTLRALSRSGFPFEVLAAKQPVKELLKDLPLFDRNSRIDEHRRAKTRANLSVASKKVQQDRTTWIRKKLSAADSDQRESFSSQFDEILSHENQRIVQAEAPDYPALIDGVNLPPAYGELDEVTKSFLISAEQVASLAEYVEATNFDYALPGSGLWRAIERELNISIIWYLRWKNGIVSTASEWEAVKGVPPRQPFKQSAGKREVNINERVPGNSKRFMGVMLGDTMHIIKDREANDLYSLLEYLDNKSIRLIERLPSELAELIRLRNDYAHVEPMTKDKFEELCLLVRGEDRQTGMLARIIKVKRQIKEHINRSAA